MSRNRLYVMILLPVVIAASDSHAKTPPGLLQHLTCVPPKTTALNVTLRPQQTDMWCWAASAQMVMEYLGKSVAQCTQANNEFNRSDCCNTPTPAACISGGWPQFNIYGFSFQTTQNAALPWPTLQAQLSPPKLHMTTLKVNNLCHFTPFTFTWHWVGGGGHMMVATGYTTNSGGNQYVFVNNPWAPGVGSTQTILYDVYVALPGDHTHWNDYYDVKK